MTKNCVKDTDAGIQVNTKIRTIHQKLTTDTIYKRCPPKEVIHGTKQRTKTIILARHGMLECGSNFKETMPQMCKSCNVIDNENHRLNECSVFENVNYANNPLKSNFENILSDNNNDDLDLIIADIEKIWEFRYANGHVKRLL